MCENDVLICKVLYFVEDEDTYLKYTSVDASGYCPLKIIVFHFQFKWVCGKNKIPTM